MIAELRQKFGAWIGGFRAAPISFAPEQTGMYYGTGLASNQPSKEALLRENIGISDIAIRAIANRLSSLNPQVKVSRRQSDGTLTDEVLDDHVLKMLLDHPHEDFTRKQMLRLLGQYIPATGEGYWLKVNNGFGVPAMLQPMPPQHVDPVIKRGMIDGYTIRDGKGQVHRISKSEVVRFWFPDPETLYEAEGYLGPNAIVTDALKFASEHLRSHYQNDATPGVILKAGGDAASPNDPQWERWQQDWARKYHNRSGQKRGLPAMLPTGWDAIQMALRSGADITPLLEHWQQNQLMNFGTPQSVLGRVVSGDRSSAETNDWVFDKHAVKPIADMISDALTSQLAADFDPKIWVEFEEFVAEDKEFNLKQEAQDLTLKVRSGQQVIEDRGGDPERAPWAEVPVGTVAETPYTGEEVDVMVDDDPSALFDPDEDGAEEDGEGRIDRTPGASRGEIAQHSAITKARSEHFSPEAEWKRVLARERKWRPKFERALKGIFNMQRKEALKRLKAIAPDEDRSRAPVSVADLFDPEAWDRLFEVRIDPIRKAAYIDAAAEALHGIGVSQTFEFTPLVSKRLNDYGASLVKFSSETTAKRLQRDIAKALSTVAEEGQGVGAAAKEINALAKAVNETFGGRRRAAATIARTELLRATQNAQIESFAQSGVVEFKRWNDNRDNDVRDSHYGSLIPAVKTQQPFTLANGNTAMHPGDSALPPADSINCRCFVTPEFDDPEGLSE
jgi:hypothetical protein